MRSPKWKVYTVYGEYMGSCKEPEAAAALVAFYGTGATIRYDHKRVVWTEGQEECRATESYDTVAKTCWERVGGKS